LTQFLHLPMQILTSSNLYQQVFTFARTHQIQSIYVALAQMLEVELCTGDQVLLRSLGAKAPWVRWIGDYQAS
jgi:predicted nucleic acid-binding protein